jgi:hypothetical protein
MTPTGTIFFAEVKRQGKYRKYKVHELCKRAEDAAEKYAESVDTFEEKKKTIPISMLKREGFGSMIWNGEGERPSGDYIDQRHIPSGIANLIMGNRPIIERNTHGRYMLRCYNTIAKSTSEDTIKKLKDLFEKVANDDEIKNPLKTVTTLKKAMEQALMAYNDKLAEIIRDLRMSPRSRGLRAWLRSWLS